MLWVGGGVEATTHTGSHSQVRTETESRAPLLKPQILTQWYSTASCSLLKSDMHTHYKALHPPQTQQTRMQWRSMTPFSTWDSDTFFSHIKASNSSVPELQTWIILCKLWTATSQVLLLIIKKQEVAKQALLERFQCQTCYLLKSTFGKNSICPDHSVFILRASLQSSACSCLCTNVHYFHLFSYIYFCL